MAQGPAAALGALLPRSQLRKGAGSSPVAPGSAQAWHEKRHPAGTVLGKGMTGQSRGWGEDLAAAQEGVVEKEKRRGVPGKWGPGRGEGRLSSGAEAGRLQCAYVVLPTPAKCLMPQ